MAGPEPVDQGPTRTPPTGTRRVDRCVPTDSSPDQPGGQQWTLPEAAADSSAADRELATDSTSALTIRLRSPILQVTVAHIGGILEDSTAKQLSMRLGVLFGRAVHVVVDLTELRTLTRGGVRALLGLHRAATSRGTQLHLIRPTAAATGTGRQQLGRLASDRLVRLAPCTEAVLAEVLASPRPTTATPRPPRPGPHRP